MNEPLKHSRIHSTSNVDWDVHRDTYVGGVIPAHNLSGGFHGLLKQWWDYYPPKDFIFVLLVSENQNVKEQLKNMNPLWDIMTLDLYTELLDPSMGKPDIIADICEPDLISKIGMSNRFDLIINQALLEHVYDPFGGIKNMFQMVRPGGYLITHTCAQNFQYHGYPQDFMRFMIDWWYELPKRIPNIQLVELYEDPARIDVLSCYQKIKK